MNALKVISHPFLVIISFLLILISGQHVGGVYIMYLLMALPYAEVHSIMALVGIALLLLCYFKYNRTKVYRIEIIINGLGLFSLVGSLLAFFYIDKDGYNTQTFNQTVPLISLCFFVGTAICFCIYNLKTRWPLIPKKARLQ